MSEKTGLFEAACTSQTMGGVPKLRIYNCGRGAEMTPQKPGGAEIARASLAKNF